MLGFLVCLLALASANQRSWEEKEYYGSGCTALAVGRKATVDGSTMVSHGNDCPTCDFRVGRVPAQKHKPGSRLPIYMAKNDYPRFVGKGSSSIYLPEHLEKGHDWTWYETEPMGYIPQVAETYAYLDGAYGLMNEHQLGMGESTCDARFGLKGIPIKNGGNALFDVAALSRVGLQRCKTARCAIDVMGKLAYEYGFYGGQYPDWNGVNMTDDSEGGEALTINDPLEVWVFEISPDDTGLSAVWAAQRVPEGHITVVTNTYSIGKINPNDEENFKFSPNIFEVAKRNGLWDESQGLLDFTQVYRSPRGHSLGRSNKTMVDRRKWEIFNKVAPSMKFDPYLPHAIDDSDLYFPFSVKPDHPLTMEEVFSLHRDVFQNTPFDMTHAVVAGPWGDPWRAAVPFAPPFNNTPEWFGTFERAVSQTWTSYTTITQSRSWLPDDIGGRLWYGPHDAMTTLFVPIYPSIQAEVPASLSTGTLNKVDTGSVWWSVCTVANYMARFYTVLLPNITAAQLKVEGHFVKVAEEVEAKVALEHDPAVRAKMITDFQKYIGSYALESWWDLFFNLVGYFHDGTFFHAGPTVTTGGVRYPNWWLEAVTPAGANKAEWANSHPDPKWDTAHVASSPATTVTTANIPTPEASQIGSVFLVFMGIVVGLVLRPVLERWLKPSDYLPLN